MTAYFIFNTIYCIIFSSIFSPKRIVSPFYIQLGTIAIAVLIIVDASFRAPIYPVFQYNQFAINLVISSIFSFFLLGVLGLIQTEIVRWIVGLNEPDETLEKKTYSIDVESKTVSDVMDKYFRNTWGLHKEKDIRDIELFQLRKPSGESVVIALRRDPEDEKKCILATVAYQMGRYSISRTKEASAVRDSIIRDLREKLREKLREENKLASPPDFSPHSLDDLASIRAYTIALRPTQSKFDAIREIWTKISRFYQFAIGFTFFTLVAISLAFFGHIITDVNTYISTLVFLIIALVIELGTSLREEFRRRKGD
ncbi:MAG: hypothetical protein H3Z54_11770 [archaeon]|nr:hypothetical protein [archaeon]